MLQFNGSKGFLMVIAALLLCGCGVLAQESGGGGAYEEYTYFLKIQKLTDPAQKAATILEYFQKYTDTAKYYANVVPECSKVLELYTQAKQYDAAVEFVTKLSDVWKENPTYLAYTNSYMARIYISKQDWANVVKWGEAAYANKPNPQGASIIAESAEKVKNYEAADKYLGEVDKAGKFQLSMATRVKLYTAAKELKDDARLLVLAVKVTDYLIPAEKPADFDAKTDWVAYKKSTVDFYFKEALGIYIRTDKLDDAIAFLTKIITTNPKDAGMYWQLGLICYQKGSAIPAAKAFAKVIALGDTQLSPKATEKLREIIKQTNADEKQYDKLVAEAKQELGSA